jgi:hypothetical protein
MTINSDEFAEFTGRPHEEVVAELASRFPDFRIQALAIGSMATSDIRQDRIRVWYNKDTGIVIRCVKR